MDQQDINTLTYLEPVIRREARRVRRNNRRAEKAGRPGRLTVEEWLAILHQYNWQCGFCKAPYETMEHKLAIIDGGGTTADNVMPACHECNEKRKDALVKIKRINKLVDSVLDCDEVTEDLCALVAFDLFVKVTPIVTE